MKIIEWYHVSLTSNISAKTWSNCTCRGCFEIVRTCRFQNWPWFWKSSKICGSNRAKQNITDFSPRLYYCTFLSLKSSQNKLQIKVNLKFSFNIYMITSWCWLESYKSNIIFITDYPSGGQITSHQMHVSKIINFSKSWNIK